MKLISDKLRSDYDFRQEYIGACTNCGKQHTVRTQADDDPEYYTRVYYLCQCGDWIEFRLPVN